MPRKIQWWDADEVKKLPEAMERFDRGDLSRAALKEMFKNRTYQAIKVKFDIGLNSPLRKLNKNGNRLRFNRIPKILRILENDRIVTYQEVLS